MRDHVYVQVPRGLWSLLEQDGFDEIELSDRGSGEWTEVIQIAWAAGRDGLGVASSLVGVHLARDQIRSFARGLAFWADEDPPPEDEGNADAFSLTLTSGAGADAVRLSIECPKGPDGRPEVDIEALTETIGSLFDANSSDTPAQG
ncbi:hypothetical protein GWI34_06490 [Actinomadura sp. DSM 109109]|nr:hypothetical protein [Actinomadura lepetitiana]